jgi:hypothetical protein
MRTAEVRLSRWDQLSVVDARRAALPGVRGVKALRSAQSDCAHTQLTWTIYLGGQGVAARRSTQGGREGRGGGGREQQVYRGL